MYKQTLYKKNKFECKIENFQNFLNSINRILTLKFSKHVKVPW